MKHENNASLETGHGPRSGGAPQGPLNANAQAFRAGVWSKLKRKISGVRHGTWSLLFGGVIAGALAPVADLLLEKAKHAELPAIGALLLLGVLAYYVGKWMEDHVNELLYRGMHARVAKVEALMGVAHEIGSTERLLKRVTTSLDEIFGLKGTAVYWANFDGFELVSPANLGIPAQVEVDDPLLLELRRHLHWQRGARFSNSQLTTELAWPMEDGGRLVGMLVAGVAVGRTVFQEDEEVRAVQHLVELLTQRLLKDGRDPLGKGEYFMSCANHYADDVARWFSGKFEMLQRYASMEPLKSNEVSSSMREVLRKLDHELGAAFNGVYVLNQSGIVIEHEAPAGVDIRGKFDASNRPYFQACKALMGPVVCDSLDTADRRDVAGRPIEILVAAVPRGTRTSFVGVLDAVIDLNKAPFGQMAAQAVRDCPRPERPRISAVRVLLIDSTAIVLGSSDSAERRVRSSVDANAQVDHLRAGLGKHSSFASDVGAIVAVRGTPFFAVAYESTDVSTMRR